MNNTPSNLEAVQPAAYDAEGRALYHHPPAAAQQPQATAHQSKSFSGQQSIAVQGGQPIDSEHQVPRPNAHQARRHSGGGYPSAVYVSRPVEPAEYTVSSDTKRRHEDSMKKYPDLDLNDTEYVVKFTERHPVGLFYIWAAEVTAMVLLTVFWIGVMVNPGLAGGFLESTEAQFNLGLAMVALLLFLLIVGWIGTVIYRGNRFLVTNERVIQYIQTGLFAKKRQTINLNGIEDVSYRQAGLLQHIIGYGSIRLSTIGDETTYRFTLVDKPAKQITILNGAVQAFKNGRPVPEELVDN